ncbi:MAG: prephenate dehydrogenase/arogenate dehydrogenase family protein [Coriobacteriia bacterium]|jgi:prephenate dehydrogenase|nr:prephenate dehydrogenase/arogenate dehydrogenase family protein [Coriobacteriia bacterium]
MRLSSVAIIGVGLIGGSFAAALKGLEHPPRVWGIDTDADSLAWAVKNGLLDDAASPGSEMAARWLGPEGADLVVLAAPAARIVEWMERLGTLGYRGTVTDVASTKSAVIEAAEKCLGEKAAFVGGHPMAGSERSGVHAADADLFRGAYYVLTPTPTTDVDAYRRVHALVSEFGSRVLSVDATAHDQAVAIVSHVPHVAASALVELAAAHAGDGGDLLRLAAGGFKDTTRVAAGSADLWTGICLDNSEAVASGVDELRDVLTEFVNMLRAQDRAGLRAWLARAAEVRRSLPAQWVPATSQLTEITVPVLDRPGVIAEVTTAASRSGCNIEAIEIDHMSEASANLIVVMTDEGDIARFVADLRDAGYAPLARPLESGEE